LPTVSGARITAWKYSWNRCGGAAHRAPGGSLESRQQSGRAGAGAGTARFNGEEANAPDNEVYSKGQDERIKTMMTEFQRKKNIHYFNVLDVDKNGFIERADFEEIGGRFATSMGFKPEDAGYDQVRAGLISLWDRLEPYADTNRDDRVSLDEFLQFQDDAIYQATPEQFDDYIGENNRGLVAMAGLRPDEPFSPAQWRWFFHGFRMDESQADDVFARLDLNHDGKLTAEEVLAATREFYFSDDPDAPGNWMFGKLTN